MLFVSPCSVFAPEYFVFEAVKGKLTSFTLVNKYLLFDKGLKLHLDWSLGLIE